MLLPRAEARKRALFQITTRRDEVIPLWAGHPAAFRHKPRLQQGREGQINIVAAQQDMFADRDPPDVGDRARRARSQVEQTEIRGAAADIDDEDVPRLGSVSVQSFPQWLGRAVLFQPAIEGCCGSASFFCNLLRLFAYLAVGFSSPTSSPTSWELRHPSIARTSGRRERRRARACSWGSKACFPGRGSPEGGKTT